MNMMTRLEVLRHCQVVEESWRIEEVPIHLGRFTQCKHREINYRFAHTLIKRGNDF